MPADFKNCIFCDKNHKLDGLCEAFSLDGQSKKAYDVPGALYLSKKPRPLTDDNMSAWQKFLYYTGKASTFIFSVGCGVSTAAAFVSLGVVSGGTASLLLAGGIFLAGTIANWFIFKTAVPQVLISLFGKQWSEDLFAIEGGVDLIKVDEDANLAKLPLLSKSAYVRKGNGTLLFFSKKTGRCEPINIDQKTLDNFDLTMKVGSLQKNQAVRLSTQGLQEIHTITGHRLISKTKMANMAIGGILALSVGITFGALAYTSTFSLTTAFGFLTVISPAFPPIAAVLASVTLVCLTALMLKDIIDLIKTENIFQSCWDFLKDMVNTGTRATVLTMEKAPTAQDLEDIKFNVGYVKVKQDVYYFNKEANKLVLLPPPQNNIDIDWNTARELSYEELAAISKITGQQHKSWLRVAFERGLMTILTVAFIPLAILGLFMTQNACAPGVKAFIMDYIPNASAAVVGVISDVICLGFALLGQIPFTISTAVQTITSFFSTNTILENCNSNLRQHIDTLDERRKTQPLSIMENLQLYALYGIAMINAIGNGCISMVGGAFSFALQVLSGAGGFWNSASAGLSSVRGAFNGKQEEEAALTLYNNQENRHFWRTTGMVAAAIFLTPLSLLFTYMGWKKAREEDSKIVRVEMSTEDYDDIRKNKKDSFNEALHDKTVQIKKDPSKPKKTVIDSADSNKKIIYMDKHQHNRFMMFKEKLQLTDAKINELNQSIDDSKRLLA